jgi:hypothetical protein
MSRIHIIIDDSEKERFRQLAAREGKSLAEWLREAARDRLAAAEHQPRMETLDELRSFLSACAARERGREPDWEEHQKVIDGSIRSGLVEP